MIVVIGEILIDLFPTYERIGGAPFNFAFHLKRFGFPVRFISRVGDDRNGERIIQMLADHGFDAADIQIDDRHPTGSVRVDLDEKGVPRFAILEDVAYDHLDLEQSVRWNSHGNQMIYFGTLVQRTDRGCERVQAFLKENGQGVTRFCDINMRPPHVHPKALAESLAKVDLLKLNAEELADIREHFHGPLPVDEAVAWLMDRFAIQAVALTRGPRGCRFYDGNAPIECPALSGTDIVDTVGAGDGFAAILAAGFLKGLDWTTTIDQATRFAARICAIPGAVPDDPSFYDDFHPFFENR